LAITVDENPVRRESFTVHFISLTKRADAIAYVGRVY
jgi:hypothetical protein